MDDACALVRELSSGPRLRAAEDRASAACARVADVEKALYAALRSLGEKGFTNLLEEEDEEESTPLSERLAAAEVAVEAAQATALGATALAERLAKRPRGRRKDGQRIGGKCDVARGRHGGCGYRGRGQPRNQDE